MCLKQTSLLFSLSLLLLSCTKTYTCVDPFGKETGKVKSYTRSKAISICKTLGSTISK